MNSDAPNAQFSIYRLDFERIGDIFSIKKDPTDEDYASVIIAAVTNSISKILSQKPSSDEMKVSYKGFKGIYFKTIHIPDWEGVALEIIEGNEVDNTNIPDDFLINVNSSYVLMRECNKKVYAMTGGYGSFYISKFVDKNFGMYLIPKLFKKDSAVLKHVLQNNLFGNQLSSHHANRKTTNFVDEHEMSSIYRQLGIEADKEIGRKLGIIYKEDEPDHKRLNIINKDSIVIRRRFSLHDLISVIENIDKLENSEDNFPLNYLVLAKKRGYSNQEILNALISYITESKTDTFILVGDEYENFMINSCTYIVCDDQNNVVIEQNDPITLDDIVAKAKTFKEKLSSAYVNTVLKKWTIQTLDWDGKNSIPTISIFDALQGYVEFGSERQPAYLFNGIWYVFDIQYANALNNEYNGLFDYQLSKSTLISKHFALHSNEKNEEDYNRKLENTPGINVTHKVKSDNVEIADAIFWDDGTVYLMHNKEGFDGKGVRDVTNQILTSAEYLQKELARGSHSERLRKFFRDITKKREYILKNISEDEFLDIFATKSICYIAGYINGYSRDTRSTYAKYLTIETRKRLSQKGYEFVTLGLCNNYA